MQYSFQANEDQVLDESASLAKKCWHTLSRVVWAILSGVLSGGFKRIRGPLLAFVCFVIMRIIAFGGLYWGSTILGNYHLRRAVGLY